MPLYSQTIQSVQAALTTTFTALDAWFDTPDAIRVYRPHDGGWTIDELLEHVTLTSHFLLIVIRNGTAKTQTRAAHQPPIPAGESDLAALEPIGHPDAFPWLRPEHMEPTRNTVSASVRETMRQQHHECLELLDMLPDGIGTLHTVRMSVQNLGQLDMYQWLYFLALHAQRHRAQIESVRAEQTPENLTQSPA